MKYTKEHLANGFSFMYMDETFTGSNVDIVLGRCLLINNGSGWSDDVYRLTSILECFNDGTYKNITLTEPQYEIY